MHSFVNKTAKYAKLIWSSHFYNKLNNTDSRTPSSNATPTCSETLKRFNEALQRFRIYALCYEALQRFIEALSNLTRSWCVLCSSKVTRMLGTAKRSCHRKFWPRQGALSTSKIFLSSHYAKFGYCFSNRVRACRRPKNFGGPSPWDGVSWPIRITPLLRCVTMQNLVLFCLSR